MTNPQPIGDPEDIRAADLAIGRYLDAQHTAAKADLEKVRLRLVDAHQRVVNHKQGGRLTAAEARLVLLAATDEAMRIGRDLINGSAETSHDQFRAAQASVDAVRRGLAASGYDVSTVGAPA